MCKDHAREARNLSVERIADLMGVTDDSLYKWLATAKMPANMIPVYENACGCHCVTEYLASTSHRLLIEIPRGRSATDIEINQLQTDAAEAIGLLLKFRTGDANAAATLDALQRLLQGAAWHHANLAKHEQPELGLFEEDE
jgi:transcriptional regulator with XRE-family HTH domain